MSSTSPSSKGPSIPIPKSRRGMKGFIADVGREMKKVTWPTRAETNRLTGVVFAVCFLICGILFILSTVFEHLINLITRGSI
jgi:preprotein translocase subunit SecE